MFYFKLKSIIHTSNLFNPGALIKCHLQQDTYIFYYSRCDAKPRMYMNNYIRYIIHKYFSSKVS